MMYQRDIFIMMYFCLDAYWEENQTEELGNICSDHNPFLWEGETSGDPACYIEFCEIVKNKDYTIEEGLEIAKKYVSTLDSKEAIKAMNDVSLADWKEGYENYLKQIEE